MENYTGSDPTDKTATAGSAAPGGHIISGGNNALRGEPVQGGSAIMKDDAPVGHDTGIGASSNTATIPTSGPSEGTFGTGGTSPGDVNAGTGTSTGSSVVSKVKGIAAQGHGVGEIFRGKVNAAVDSMFGDKVGQAKNEEVARKGMQEVAEKRFVHTESSERGM